MQHRILIPIIEQIYKEPRFCERYNYIPRPTPRNSNRYVWHNTYLSELIDIYIIIITIINERYPYNKIKWATNHKLFHNLSRMLYHCSSKYLKT